MLVCLEEQTGRARRRNEQASEPPWPPVPQGRGRRGSDEQRQFRWCALSARSATALVSGEHVASEADGPPAASNATTNKSSNQVSKHLRACKQHRNSLLRQDVMESLILAQGKRWRRA